MIKSTPYLKGLLIAVLGASFLTGCREVTTGIVHPEGDSTAPIISGFSIPASSNSLSVSGISLAATDNVGVTGYLLSESAAVPGATDTRWTAVAPVAYPFSAAGPRTLYAWAKDAAGNVSAGRNATVTITLPSSTAFLSWTAPTTSTDGTPVSDLTGYNIYYGTTSGVYTTTVSITGATSVTDVISNLPGGGKTYYFVITAVSSSGGESAHSNEASKLIL